MGYKLKRKDIGKLAPNEEMDICLELVPEMRAAIHGIVKFKDTGKPVHGAVVKLFKKCDGPCDLEPVTFAFTDKCGQFLFGVHSNVEYVVKIFWYEPECQGPPHCDKDHCHDHDNDWDIDC